MKKRLILGDCLEVLKKLPNNCIDAIITDPPYGLVSISKRFGNDKARNTPAMETKEGGVFARKAKGFMGKEWDGSGIENSVDMWSECLRVLKPGGHLLAFGGTRTYHRMACAIEDAGFEVRDMIEWVYGSGFPKSLNIGKMVDKLQSNEREDLGKNPSERLNKPEVDIYKAGIRGKECRITKGNSEWEGWGTALKPSHEPICMARKPLAEKTVAENCLKWGTGGINIDESRIGAEVRINKGMSAKKPDGAATFRDDNWVPKDVENVATGRFPANFIHDGSVEVLELFPNTKGSKASGLTQTKARSWANNSIAGINRTGFDDNGSAARFFYCAKASKSERDRGCEGLELKDGGAMEANTTDVMQLGGASLKGEHKAREKTRNNHPTVKPVALMEYLIKLISREGHVVLDPFMGSGTTGVACKKLNRNFVGIEKEPEYMEIAKSRINSSGS